MSVPLTKTPVRDALLIDARELAGMLGVCRNSVLKMDTTGRLGPRAIRLGRRVLWRRTEVEAWVAAECPPRRVWLEERP